MGRTSLWADAVLRDRAPADAHGRDLRRARRKPSHARPARRIGAVRLVPVLVGTLTLAFGACAGTAYAYFTTTGSGNGQASARGLTPVVVEQATVVPGSLFPGQVAGLSLEIKNPNDRSLTLLGVSEVGTTVSVTPATAGCTGTTAGVSVAATAATGLNLPLKASTTTTGVTTLVIPTGATMSESSPNACQTKSFHIKVSVKVRS